MWEGIEWNIKQLVPDKALTVDIECTTHMDTSTRSSAFRQVSQPGGGGGRKWRGWTSSSLLWYEGIEILLLQYKLRCCRRGRAPEWSHKSLWWGWGCTEGRGWARRMQCRPCHSHFPPSLPLAPDSILYRYFHSSAAVVHHQAHVPRIMSLLTSPLGESWTRSQNCCFPCWKSRPRFLNLSRLNELRRKHWSY